MIAILATLAGLAISTYGGGDDGVEGQARAGIAQAELATLQQALVRFHRDTGWLPGQGPFGVVSDACVPATSLPTFVTDETSDTTLQETWLRHPANLWPLFVNPFGDPDGTGLQVPHALAAWDPVRRRGWNGPYLQLGAGGRCAVPRVPSGWTGHTTWPMDTPLGTNLPVFALHDPFAHGTDGPFTWSDFAGTPIVHNPGQPYLLLDAGTPATSPSERARVVSLGPDGLYGSTFPAAFIGVESLVVIDPTSDDLGRFVHR